MKEEIWKGERHGRMKEGKKKKKAGRKIQKTTTTTFDRILTRQTNTTHSNIRVERQASETQPEHVTDVSETQPEHVTEDRGRTYRTDIVQLQHSHKPPDTR